MPISTALRIRRPPPSIRQPSSHFFSASCSAGRKRASRAMRSSKSTLWASKSGPSTHANLMPSPILTRQPPHIPVPSTITGLRLTTVWMFRGRVTSAHAFIMIGGPIASTSSMSGCAASACSMPFVTRPLMPAEPSSVQTMSSSQTERNLSSQNITPRLRKPSTPITWAPLLRIRAGLREDRRDAEAAADAQDLLPLADVARNAHRADDRVQARADPAIALHLARRLADGLDHQRDRARCRCRSPRASAECARPARAPSR